MWENVRPTQCVFGVRAKQRAGEFGEILHRENDRNIESLFVREWLRSQIPDIRSFA